MEETVKPDRKYFIKSLLILLTISVFVFVTVSIIHLIIYLTDGEPGVPLILWLVSVGSVLIMWIVSYPIIKLWIKNLSYTIRGDRVTIQKGILTKTQQNIPYRSVTDFILQRSLYDRFLGIGSIKIQTAGQTQSPSGYEGNIAGLIEYEKWHHQLREKVKSLHPVSESLTTSEPVPKSTTQLLEHILVELKEIRKQINK